MNRLKQELKRPKQELPPPELSKKLEELLNAILERELPTETIPAINIIASGNGKENVTGRGLKTF